MSEIRAAMFCRVSRGLSPTFPMMLSASIEMTLKVRHKALNRQSKPVLRVQITNQQRPSSAVPPRTQILSTSKRTPGRGCIFPGCFSCGKGSFLQRESSRGL